MSQSHIHYAKNKTGSKQATMNEQMKSSSIPTMEFKLEMVSKDDSTNKDNVTSFASHTVLKPQFSSKVKMQKSVYESP